MQGTTMSRVCNCMTPSYMQQGFSITTPFLEKDNEASLLQYFMEEGLFPCALLHAQPGLTQWSQEQNSYLKTETISQILCWVD